MEYLGRKLYLPIMGLFLSLCSFAQDFENSAGQREKIFVYRVKQIDEFFERFNNDTSSFIREVYRSYGIKFNIDRPTLIRSLFNYRTNTWLQSSIDSFVNKALSTQMPSGRNFYGDDWYAEANCKFRHHSVEIEIPVILKIQTDDQGRSKWVICGVKKSLAGESSRLIAMSEINLEKFITPSSHANYFIELAKVFEDKKNLSSYFDESFFRRDNAIAFYNASLQDNIKFLHVKSIKYHFLQVSNYIFTVEYFPRKDLNAGWLINSLKQVTLPEKNKFVKQLLGEYTVVNNNK